MTQNKIIPLKLKMYPIIPVTLSTNFNIKFKLYKTKLNNNNKNDNFFLVLIKSLVAENPYRYAYLNNLKFQKICLLKNHL